MVYNPATDFAGLWRNAGGQVSKMEMPGLDFVVAALARAGFITLSVSATPPLANQSTTAWLQAAVPSNSAEGVMRLWDPVTTTYVAATPALLFKMLQTAAGQNGVSWWTTTLGAPSNLVGSDGDFAIRLDEPGGIYGPKAAGAWPADPIPGTTNEVTSVALDNTFGNTPGQLIYRGATEWDGLPIGTDGSFLITAGGFPGWAVLSAMLDALYGNLQGSVLFRGAADWQALGPGPVDNVLTTQGPAANPIWSGKSSEFPSGTVMLFQQTAAPPGWTKSVVLNDYGLRVTNGTVGTVAGTAFSTVFSQTVTGSHALSTPEMPSHGHNYLQTPLSGGVSDITPGSVAGVNPQTNGVTGLTGGGGGHTHSIQLSLSYVDVIIASKN